MTLTQITEKGIKDGEIINADINASAAIAGTKVSPNFGSQAVSTTGNLTIDTDTLHVDSSNDRVGINTTSPASGSELDVNGKIKTGAIGIGTVPLDHQHIHIESANPRVLIRSTGTNPAKLMFGDQSNNDAGVIEYAHSSNVMGFSTGTLERMRINSVGAVMVGGTLQAGSNGGLNTEVTSSGNHTTALSLINQGTADESGVIISHRGKDDAGNQTDYNYIRMVADDTGSGSEDGSIRFWTLGSGTLGERVRITSTGRLGIGTNAPTSTLHVAGDTQFTTSTGVQHPFNFRNDFTPNSYRSDLLSTINVTSNNALRIGSIATSNGVTLQGNRANDSSQKVNLILNPDGGKVGIGDTNPQSELVVSGGGSTADPIIMSHVANSNGGFLGFGLYSTINSKYTFKVTNNGRVHVNDGIDFNMTSNASGMTNELLDDYEEGTFSIGVTDSNNTFTTGQESGRYIKIGHVVHCTFTINCSISGTSGYAFFLTGFPFTVKNYGSHANEGLGTCKGTGQEIQLEAQQDNTTVKARNPSSGSAMSVNDVGCTNNTVKSVRGYIIYQTT